MSSRAKNSLKNIQSSGRLEKSLDHFAAGAIAGKSRVCARHQRKRATYPDSQTPLVERQCVLLRLALALEGVECLMKWRPGAFRRRDPSIRYWLIY
jgi:hypothetical protein